MSSVKRIFPLLTVIFLGYFGFSLALPLFPPLFLNPDLNFLSPDTTVHMRRILLGILFAMYPFGQFIGAPLLGKWSDKYGRKPVILISLIALFPAYLVSAFSILYMQPVLLFASRFFCGLLEGDIVIAQAAIADTSEDSKTKTKNFGWLVSLSSTAFFFGPLIGGKLADSQVVPWFHYDTPFWCAAALSLISFSVVALLFHETHDKDPTIEVSLKSLVRTFSDGLKFRRLRILFTANFFIFLAIFFFLNFFSAYLVDVYHFSISVLGEINAYLAIPVILVPFVFGRFSKMWSTKKTTQIGSLLLGVSYLIFVLIQSPWSLLFTLIPIGFFMGMGFAFPAILVSDAVSKRFQGQALGTNQSIQVFAEAFTALIGGFLMALFSALPIYLAALCGLIGALALTRQKD